MLGIIKRAIIAPHSRSVKFALMLAALGVAAGLRIAIDRGANGVPFLTFYPVILLSAIFLGGRYAAIAALIAGIIVSRVFLPFPWLASNDPARLVMLLLYGLTILIIIVTGDLMRQLILENEAHIRQTDSFNSELQHRTKNALQIVRALIARGPRDEDPADYYANLAGRLDALAKANELLRFGVLESCAMKDLTRAAIAPFDRKRFHVEGADCQVSRGAATPLMMALHELCTNACKYGSLSAETGTVSIRWECPGPQGAPGVIMFDWCEQGGPAVTPPTHRGLGTRLLRPNGGLLGVDLDWRPGGLACRMKVQSADGEGSAPVRG